MGRLVGVDYGTRRIGLALSDGRERIASPAVVIESSGAVSQDAASILDWAGQQEAAGIVVGLPLSMDGSDSDQTRLSRRLADELHKRGTLPVELWDERLSTFQADEHLAADAVRPSRRRRRRDALAAQVVLQSFLDARQTEGGAGA